MQPSRFGLWVVFVGLVLSVVGRLTAEAQVSGSARHLRKAVLQRYPAPQFHMDRYRIVPYGAKAFAVTTDGTVYAVWERKGSGWSWIFPFTSTQAQGSIDFAFREAGFSPSMQQRLGGRLAAPVPMQRF